MSPQPLPRPRRTPGDRRVADRGVRPATAGGTALAVQPDRRRAPGSSPAGRPHLEVVDESRLSAATRRKRTRALMIVAGIVTVVSIFALASFHAMLLSGQGRLDQLQREVAAERTEYESLRQQVAELESPGRIVEAAQNQLGMVPPEEVTWLVPTVTAEGGSVPSEPAQVAIEPPPPSAPWAAMKPFLGGKR